MKKSIEIFYDCYERVEDLQLEEQQLFHFAKTKLDFAYAPYSSFHVVAAALLDNGTYVYATNQENAAYPNGMCAEQGLVAHLGSNYPSAKIRCIGLVTSRQNSDIPDTPCGQCRQVMTEMANRQPNDVAVLLFTQSGKCWKFASIKDLLPFQFSL